MRTRIALALAACALSFTLSGVAHAAPDAEAVRAGDHTLFSVTAANGLSSHDRAQVIDQRLSTWLANSGDKHLHVASMRKGPTIMLGDEPLVVVSAEDARLNDTSPEALADSWAKQIEDAVPSQAPSPAHDPLHGWELFKRLLALASVLLGGTIAAWLASWGSARIAEDPRRYALPLSSSAVTVLGGIATLAIAVATLAASLAYLPVAQSLPLACAIVVLGAMALIASAELLGNLAGGLVIALTPLFSPGDFVRIGGHAGRVKRIGMFFTRLETERHGERLVPNGAALRRGVAFAQPTRGDSLQLSVRLAYTVMRELAQAIVVEAALRTHGVSDDPLPECLVAELEDEVIRYDLHASVLSGERPEAVASRFHIHLLDVLAENGLGPGGQPMTRAKLRIGMAPVDPDFGGPSSI